MEKQVFTAIILILFQTFVCFPWQPGVHGQLSELDKKPPQLLKKVNLKSLCIAVTHPLPRDGRLLLPPCLHAVPLLVLHPFTPPPVRSRHENQDLTPDWNSQFHIFFKYYIAEAGFKVESLSYWKQNQILLEAHWHYWQSHSSLLLQCCCILMSL